MNTVRDQLDIPFERARQMGAETIAILKNGKYVSRSGRAVDLLEDIKRAVENTTTYSPENRLANFAKGDLSLKVTVQNTTTLHAVNELIKKGYRTAALNMASATFPGGGFLHGSRAQEEYLCRSSALYLCLLGNEMYNQHDFKTNPFYDEYVIYSPDVPIFRNDDGELIDQPFSCSILSSPAVRAFSVYRFVPQRSGEIENFMWKRILKVLAVASIHKHKALVLGAWGCGSFGNNGTVVAQLFRTALAENFVGVFEKVTFAIADWSPNFKYIKPFMDVFS